MNHQSSITYDVENIVFTGTFTFSDEFDEWAIRGIMKNSYKKENFPALMCPKDGSSLIMLLFKSGKFVCTGGKTVDESEAYIQHVMTTMKRHGIHVSLKECKIVNIVASGNFNRMINIDEFVFVMENAQYEPEVFPGLIYRPEKMLDDDVAPVFLFFKKGKFVCTKLNDEKMIKKWIEHANDTLSSKGLYLDSEVAN